MSSFSDLRGSDGQRVVRTEGEIVDRYFVICEVLTECGSSSVGCHSSAKLAISAPAHHVEASIDGNQSGMATSANYSCNLLFESDLARRILALLFSVA